MSVPVDGGVGAPQMAHVRWSVLNEGYLNYFGNSPFAPLSSSRSVTSPATHLDARCKLELIPKVLQTFHTANGRYSCAHRYTNDVNEL